MRRITALLVAFLLVAMGCASLFALAAETPAPAVKAKPAAQQDRVDGIIVRFNKEKSTIEVRERRTNAVRNIVYSASTAWTVRNKPADISLLKDGVRVICLGKYDAKGTLAVTRIDFR